LAVLKQFGYNVDNLNGEKVHSLFNVMTMEHNAHDLFDRLDLWFEKTVSILGICFEFETKIC
jgi:HNH endonuclease